MLCYFVPVVGALLADSFLGRFRTIYYFSVIYAIGNVLMCLAATPPVSLPPIPFTMLGLLLIAAGTGGIKPCVAAFGGDQFRLPQEEIRLQQFFSIFYFSINFGGFVGMVLTPILRKTVVCFGDDTCYALGFGFPAALMIMALFLFIVGKPLYRIKSPKENIILQFINCASYAMMKKLKSKERSFDHWLDYAADKYEQKLIGDMKIVLAILFLYIPLPLFWSLFDQQGSRWTFQASRMNGELFGMQLLPDQMQVINPAIVLVLIPLFDKSLYPMMDNVDVMTSPLQKMVMGGFMAGFAFIASGILELKLEDTYPVLPNKHHAHLNFINTLPCDIQILNPFNHLQTINATRNFVFQDVTARNLTSYEVAVFTPYLCGNISINIPHLGLHVVATEFQVDSIVITLMGSTLNAFLTDPEQLKKSLSGKPKVRVAFVRSFTKIQNNMSVTLYNGHGFTDIYYVPHRQMSSSAYMELDPGRYKYSVILNNNLAIVEEDKEIFLELGGVYTLIIQEIEGEITFSKLYIMTPPNTIHMLWLIPQYTLISIAEVMFAISGLQFSFTQAPKSMKTLTIAAWYVSVAIGNLLVIIITQAKLFRSQANEFFLFAGLILVDMVIFMIMTTSYQFVRLEADGSSSVFQDEGLPLLEASEDLLILEND